MDINRMRLGLVYIFKESNEIGSQSKLNLINFIEQADEHQLKMLALYGDLTSKESLDEASRELLDFKFEAASKIKESLSKASLKALKEIVKKKVISEAPIKYGATKIIDMAAKHGRMTEKRERAGCEKWSIKTPFKDQKYKDKMLACKAAATIKGAQASIAYANKLASHCREDGGVYEKNRCKKKIYAYIVDLKSEINFQKKHYLKNK